MRKPVILVIDADAEELEWQRSFVDNALEDAVVICRGPTRDQQCPLLTGHDCPKIHAADGILFQLDLEDDESRQILARYTDELDVPIRVVATGEQSRRFGSQLSSVEVIAPPVGPAKLDAFAAEVEHTIP